MLSEKVDFMVRQTLQLYFSMETLADVLKCLSDNDEFIYSATVDMNARCGTEDKLSLLRIPLWSALGHVDINLENNSYCSFRVYLLKKIQYLYRWMC